MMPPYLPTPLSTPTNTTSIIIIITVIIIITLTTFVVGLVRLERFMSFKFALQSEVFSRQLLFLKCMINTCMNFSRSLFIVIQTFYVMNGFQCVIFLKIKK